MKMAFFCVSPQTVEGPLASASGGEGKALSCGQDGGAFNHRI